MSDTDNNTKTEEKNQDESLGHIEEMYRAGVHFGYSRSTTHPKMKPFFYGLRNNMQIFNLEKVWPLLEKAVEFLKGLGQKRAVVLLVGTKPEASHIIEAVGKSMGFPYVTERWLGGTLTNFSQIKRRIEQFENLRRQKEAGEFKKLSKKEVSRLEKQLSKLERLIGGIRELAKVPDVLLIIDAKAEHAAVTEAKKMRLPIIAIMNSDNDPSVVDYPIPGNDSTVSSIQYLLDKLMNGYKKGKQSYKPEEKKEKAPAAAK